MLRKFQPNFTYMKCPKHLVRRSIQAAVYYALNFKCHFVSSLLVFILYRWGMRLLSAMYYIADISCSVLPDLNFPFFSSKPLTAYFSWVFFYIPTYRELHKLLYHSKIQSPTYLIFRLLNFWIYIKYRKIKSMSKKKYIYILYIEP